MFRTFLSLASTRAARVLTGQAIRTEISPSTLFKQERKLPHSLLFSSFAQSTSPQIKNCPPLAPLPLARNNFLAPNPSPLVNHNQVRTVIKFSLKNGRRRTVRTVLKRFYRLNCGNWIRTIAGKDRKKWKRLTKRKCRNQEHVFCNATQCRMLDKMVSKYWRTPKYYIKNPYEPYEWREHFWVTRRKPWRPEGCDYE